ncbi:hypothetical protein NL526_27540, partial [Klebsiella pneumoniae]|nr:hypothetical protein [Klebsiella pneumoniae]
PYSVPVDPHSIVARLHAQGGPGVGPNASSRDIPDSSSSGIVAGAAGGEVGIDQDVELEPAEPASEESVVAKCSPAHSQDLADEDDDEEEHLT